MSADPVEIRAGDTSVVKLLMYSFRITRGKILKAEITI
jgi:hypothetical protein